MGHSCSENSNDLREEKKLGGLAPCGQINKAGVSAFTNYYNGRSCPARTRAPHHVLVRYQLMLQS